MIRKGLLFTVFPIIVFLGIAGLFGSLSAFQQKVSFPEDKRSEQIKAIGNYKSWTRVNPEPQLVGAVISALCAAPTAKIQMNPHDNKFITVYVNKIGSHAMMEEKTPHFPEGSVIVKEKLKAADSTTPELLTVMIKREAGYNPDNGDWEFLVMDGKAEKVQASGRLENCQACHQQEKATDYVSRRYLPTDVREKLK
jgi:hypothetical protein